MKRIITAAVMLIFAISAAWISNYIVKKDLNNLSMQLEELSEFAETADSAQLLDKLNKVYEKWEASSLLLHLFINNNVISRVEGGMDALRFYVDSDKLLFRQSCVDAMTAINEIIEIEKVTFKNIF